MKPKWAHAQTVCIPNSYSAFFPNSLLRLRLQHEMEVIISHLK